MVQSEGCLEQQRPRNTREPCVWGCSLRPVRTHQVFINFSNQLRSPRSPAPWADAVASCLSPGLFLFQTQTVCSGQKPSRAGAMEGGWGAPPGQTLQGSPALLLQTQQPLCSPALCCSVNPQFLSLFHHHPGMFYPGSIVSG